MKGCKLGIYSAEPTSILIALIVPLPQISIPPIGINQADFHEFLSACAFYLEIGNSPKTITNVILMVFTLAFGINPRELALLQSGSFSRAIFLRRASVNGTGCNRLIQETQQLTLSHQVPKKTLILSKTMALSID